MTGVHAIESGLPQGSVLGSVLNAVYTFDITLSWATCTSTYGDDTVIISASKNKNIAAANKQSHLVNESEKWMKDWDSSECK